jgi:hypothetical protein
VDGEARLQAVLEGADPWRPSCSRRRWGGGGG